MIKIKESPEKYVQCNFCGSRSEVLKLDSEEFNYTRVVYICRGCAEAVGAKYGAREAFAAGVRTLVIASDERIEKMYKEWRQ